MRGNSKKSCGNDVLNRLKTTKDVGELSDLIQSISENEIKPVLGYIPVLLKHRSWLIRADTLDMIGCGKLKQFKKHTLNILRHDKNEIVKRYALMAYFDIAGKRSIPVIEDFSRYKNTRVRKTALCLLYIAKQDVLIIKELEKIVLRRNSVPESHYSIYVILDYYLSLEKHPELLSLFKSILGRFKENQQVDSNLLKIVRGLEKKEKRKKRE